MHNLACCVCLDNMQFDTYPEVYERCIGCGQVAHIDCAYEDTDEKSNACMPYACIICAEGEL